MEIRAEQPEDREAVRQVHLAAFGRVGEANLVDQLRGLDSTFSWVAVESDQVIGHLFFSPVEIEGEYLPHLPLLGLAPVAVRPDRQRQGIGSLLIQSGLQTCARAGIKAIVVLGNPAFYSRFGFIPAREKRLGCKYPVPEECFMVLELESGALANCWGTDYQGTVSYHLEFDQLEES